MLAPITLLHCTAKRLFAATVQYEKAPLTAVDHIMPIVCADEAEEKTFDCGAFRICYCTAHAVNALTRDPGMLIQ